MRLPVAALLLCLPCVTMAQVYKCVDKYGRTQFSQTRPRDANCEASAAKAPPPSGGNVDSLMQYSKQIDQSRRQEAGVQQKTEQEQAYRAARCSAARSRLAVLRQSGRVVIVDDKGERHYQDDTSKQQMENDAQQAVARDCG